jgi:hypothetical protein
MNPEDQDAALSSLLKDHATVRATCSPGFRPSVWARIEQRRKLPASWRGWVRLHFAGFVMAAAASVVAAAALGGMAGKAHESAMRETMLARYVASIDPHHQIASSSVPAIE